MLNMERFAEARQVEVAELKTEGRDDEARMLETLASVAIFDGVPPEVLRRLASDVGESAFPAGSVVVREGDSDGVGFFVVVSGVGVVRVGDHEVRTVREGDHFGAVATIDGGPRTATVCAATELRCLILADAAFHELIHDHPGIGWKLLVYLAGLVRASG
jgi:CRP/FNR family cyclic AMP-dependent transcriptional regulator